ncbi:helix-turn-helix protein [Promicromonospora sp. AC04]|uniref:helix-turn-helix domain-containing protein n=1 Tax=Promicromonospora sp. AC04 TaxID=2135723 RepID=UPI000D4982D0|nr:helix-turn-helix domain-containing protein [Promicromonospora sp. AC04]PUB21461.1 helix-turn-helix protein [Promicromonospora sp. AC04]
MNPDEIDALLASPETALAEALAQEDQHLLHSLVMLRRELGLSQAAVAERMGVSQAAVSLFERVGNDPRMSTVRRYARALEAMVHHKVDPAGCGDTSASESITHFSTEGVSSAPTAAAAWGAQVPSTFVEQWEPLPASAGEYNVGASHD